MTADVSISRDPLGAYDVGDTISLKARFGTNLTYLLAEAAASTTGAQVAAVTGYATGDKVIVNPGGLNEELNTIATITGAVLGMASAWIHHHHVRERLWERTDPTAISLKVKGPSGSTTAYTTTSTSTGVTQEAQGVFARDLALSSAGLYGYKWEGTGAAPTAAEGYFTVRPSAFAT